MADMIELFSADQLAALTGGEPVSDDLYQAVHDWILAEIQGEVGDEVTDPPQPGVVAIALEMARPLALNPGNISNKVIGPLQITYARSADVRQDRMSHRQRLRLRRACGLRSSFSISTATRSWDHGNHHGNGSSDS